MKQLNITKFQKRIILIYVFLNIFALTVNYLGFNLKYKYGSYEVPPNSTQDWWVTREFYLFTNSTGDFDFEQMNKKHLYPFVDFNKSDDRGLKHTFRGLFPYYDTTEFVVYLIPVLVFIGYKKFW